MKNKNTKLHIKIILFSLVTALLTAVTNIFIDRTFSINVFSFWLWFVIPVGAVLVGVAGASGGFLACKYFKIIPSGSDATALVVVAALTMFMIYYLDFITLTLDSGAKVSEIVSFSEYMKIIATQTHMIHGRSLRHDTGALGGLGYGLLALEFVGVLMGGAAVLGTIKDGEICPECNVFLQNIGVKVNLQPTIMEAMSIHKRITSGDVDDYIYALEDKADCDSGDVMIKFTLMRCKKCGYECVTEKFSILDKKSNGFVEYKDLNGKTSLAKGSNISSLFGG